MTLIRLYSVSRQIEIELKTIFFVCKISPEKIKKTFIARIFFLWTEFEMTKLMQKYIVAKFLGDFAEVWTGLNTYPHLIVDVSLNDHIIFMMFIVVVVFQATSLCFATSSFCKYMKNESERQINMKIAL